MKNFILLVCLFIGTLSSFGQSSEPEMKVIFDGDDLDHWVVPENNIWWTMKDGILLAKSDSAKTGSNLWTKKSYTDFVVQLDFKFGEGTIDSGIFMRGSSKEFLQIQIGESGSLKRDMTGSPHIPSRGYPVEAEGVAKLLQVKGWNTMKAKAIGNTYKVWLNGVEVMNYTFDTDKLEGPIGLQLHPNRDMSIEFKNVLVAEIK